jgi:hypothetical protein
LVAPRFALRDGLRREEKVFGVLQPHINACFTPWSSGVFSETTTDFS